MTASAAADATGGKKKNPERAAMGNDRKKKVRSLKRANKTQ